MVAAHSGAETKLNAGENLKSSHGTKIVYKLKRLNGEVAFTNLPFKTGRI